MPEIRRVKKGDVNKIFNLALRVKEIWVSQQTKFYSKKELYEWINKPKDNILLVAVTSKKIIGFSFIKIMSSEWAYIDTIFVDPACRNNNIGTSLLNKNMQILNKKGVIFISGLVGENHFKSRSFWKKKDWSEGKELRWIEKNI